MVQELDVKVYNGYGISNDVESVKLIRKSELKTKLDSLQIVKTIKDKSNVFFLDNVVFPRQTLREYGKSRGINIVRKVETADYLVIKNNDINNYIKSYREYGLFKNIHTGELLLNLSWDQRATHRIFNDYSMIANDYCNIIDSLVDDINNLFTINKPIIDQESLNNQCLNSTIIDYKNYLNYVSMLNSTDQIVKDMAIRLISMCNRDASEFYIACLYNKFKQDFFNSKEWNSVNLRSFRIYVESKSWGRTRMDNELSVLRFFIDGNYKFKIDSVFFHKMIEEDFNKISNGILRILDEVAETEMVLKYNIKPSIKIIEFENEEPSGTIKRISEKNSQIGKEE